LEISTMLALSLVQEIDRLLHEGELSQRKIAERLGVSRGTVGAIARGQRPLFGKAPKPDESEERGPSLQPQRCRRCGFLVFLPCLVCRTREYRQSGEILRVVAAFRRTSARRPCHPPARRGPRIRRARVA
jgi:hypothetical protein